MNEDIRVQRVYVDTSICSVSAPYSIISSCLLGKLYDQGNLCISVTPDKTIMIKYNSKKSENFNAPEDSKTCSCTGTLTLLTGICSQPQLHGLQKIVHSQFVWQGSPFHS